MPVYSSILSDHDNRRETIIGMTFDKLKRRKPVIAGMTHLYIQSLLSFRQV